jgi:hypothetical protein
MIAEYARRGVDKPICVSQYPPDRAPAGATARQPAERGAAGAGAGAYGGGVMADRASQVGAWLDALTCKWEFATAGSVPPREDIQAEAARGVNRTFCYFVTFACGSAQ